MNYYCPSRFVWRIILLKCTCDTEYIIKTPFCDFEIKEEFKVIIFLHIYNDLSIFGRVVLKFILRRLNL